MSSSSSPRRGRVEVGGGSGHPLRGWQARLASRACARCSAAPTCGSRCAARSRAPCAARARRGRRGARRPGRGQVVVAGDREARADAGRAARAVDLADDAASACRSRRASSWEIRSSVCAPAALEQRGHERRRVVARHAAALDGVVDRLLHALAREHHDLARVEDSARAARAAPDPWERSPPRGRELEPFLRLVWRAGGMVSRTLLQRATRAAPSARGGGSRPGPRCAGASP